MVLFLAEKVKMVKGKDNLSFTRTTDSVDRARCKASEWREIERDAGKEGGAGMPKSRKGGTAIYQAGRENYTDRGKQGEKMGEKYERTKGGIRGGRLCPFFLAWP